jgi:hypothetical protein
MRVHHDAAGCPLCWQNRRGRTNYKGHWGYRRPPRERPLQPWEVCVMKRPKSVEEMGGERPDPGKLLENVREVYDLLTDGTWEDGSRRALATLLLFAEGSNWKLCVSDRATGRVAFVTGRTPEDVIAITNEQLLEERLDWRTALNKGTPAHKRSS